MQTEDGWRSGASGNREWLDQVPIALVITSGLPADVDSAYAEHINLITTVHLTGVPSLFAAANLR